MSSIEVETIKNITSDLFSNLTKETMAKLHKSMAKEQDYKTILRENCIDIIL